MFPYIQQMLVLRGSWSRSLVSFSFSTARAKKQKTFYQLLEVPTTASATAIKKNYLKLAKIYHPDVYKGADKNRFQKIQDAYKILSNQSERSRYDQSLGLSVTPPEPSETSDTSQQTKPKNDFSYSTPLKTQINLDEEYEKFFKKKSTTHFEDIRLHEQNQFKAMSEKQRIRRRFKEVYTNPNYDYKMNYSKSYNQILDDQINQRNIHEEELKQKEEEYKKKYSEKGILLRMKLIKIGAVMVFIGMMPFILSIRTKMILEKEAKASYEQKVKEVFSQMEKEDIRSRMRFD